MADFFSGAASFPTTVAPSASGRSGPSLVGQLVSVPAAAYDQTMAGLLQPAPQGASMQESIEFESQKVIAFQEMRNLTSAATIVAKAVKKDVETLLNNK